MERAIVALVALAGIAVPATAAVLSGSVAIERRGRPAAGVEDVIVSFASATVELPVAATEVFEIATVGKQFEPRVLAVSMGSRVRFPNRDAILHNVFSVSRPNAFDLGLYAESPGSEVTLEHPGLVRVFCNVHREMVAYVLVLETPYWSSPDPDGRFRLDNLPEGAGTLTVWHERADAVIKELSIPSAEAIAVTLKVSKPRVPDHKNKNGKSYSRRRRRY